jgi:hypothetical protein
MQTRHPIITSSSSSSWLQHTSLHQRCRLQHFLKQLCQQVPVPHLERAQAPASLLLLLPGALATARVPMQLLQC